MSVTEAQGRALRIVKVVHTIAWAVFAGCILAIPIVVWRGTLMHAGVLIAVVFAEVVVRAFNQWHCPLTNVAARYTTDRSDNFDIYLPAWLARYNKVIFGSLYVAGLLLTLVRGLNWFR
jgi:hypothetical protein